MLTESIDEAIRRSRYERTDVHGEGRHAPCHSEPPQGEIGPAPLSKSLERAGVERDVWRRS